MRLPVHWAVGEEVKAPLPPCTVTLAICGQNVTLNSSLPHAYSVPLEPATPKRAGLCGEPAFPPEGCR